MGFTAKAKSSSGGWGMGFFLVFFHEDEAIINKKKTNLLSSSLSSSSSSTPSSSSSIFKPSTVNNFLRRTNSTHLLTRAQSTISICALLIFVTLLLFTVSTFEPTTTAATTHLTSRRQLISSNSPLYKTSKNSTPWSINILKHNSHYKPEITSATSFSHALQGMGTLYRRGTKAMNDLIVGHVVESVTVHELRLFLRLLHRSGLTSRSDLVFLFPSTSDSFGTAIREENESFLKLIHQYKQVNGTSVNSVSSFDVTQFVKSRKKVKEWGEPIWGPRIRINYREEGGAESTQLSYGSVVGFDVDELDPENSLAGFLDHVPMSLRRWACYPMLLGRVRRNFKHVMLVDLKDMLLLGDPLGRVRNRSPESVYFLTMTHNTPSKHGRKNSEKTQSPHQKSANPAIIMGGARGVRRLSNTMLTEIVRVTTQHKRKNPVSESGLFNQLTGNEFILKLKGIKLVSSTESIPNMSSLTGLNTTSGFSLSLSNFTMVRRGNSSIDIYSSIMKQICSSPFDFLVYSDC